MALQTSGAISLNDIHVEAGGTTGTQASINDSDIRDMISKSSGAQMSFSEWYGASAGAIWGDRWVTGGGARFHQSGSGQSYDSLGSGNMEEIQYDDFNTGGTSSLFGSLTDSIYGARASSNGSRIVYSGQQWYGSWTKYGHDRMKYITVGTTGNASTFGTLATPGRSGAAAMNTNGRGLDTPGLVDSNTFSSNINYFQIDTTGNAATFGTIPFGVMDNAGTEALSGRCMFIGGGRYSSTNYNSMHYISSTQSVGGTGSDFGDLATRRRYVAACTNGTRALIWGGAGHATYSNTLENRFNSEYVTIATTGNASSFGTYTYARWMPASTSNGTRGIMISGYVVGASGSNYTYNYTFSNIEYNTISTTGNASTFGNLQYYARNFDAASGN